MNTITITSDKDFPLPYLVMCTAAEHYLGGTTIPAHTHRIGTAKTKLRAIAMAVRDEKEMRDHRVPRTYNIYRATWESVEILDQEVMQTVQKERLRAMGKAAS